MDGLVAERRSCNLCMGREALLTLLVEAAAFVVQCTGKKKGHESQAASEIKLVFGVGIR